MGPRWDKTQDPRIGYWTCTTGPGIHIYMHLQLLHRSEAGIITKKLYINGVWDEIVTLGRFIPTLLTFTIWTLVERRHITASMVFRTLWYFIAVRDTLGFFCQMAVRNVSELSVCFQRFKVGMQV